MACKLAGSRVPMKREAAGVVLAVLGLGSAWAAPGVVERINAEVHEGVASCASSVCHGAASPATAGRVRQDEVAVWQDRDPHAGAYRTLLGEESRAIAAKLGLPNAHEAPECLACHADFVPAEKRGERFQLADGVGCEACHGGAGRWLSSHARPDVPHAENLALGMYPTSDPAARAELCLSCHMGSRERRITHRIMGAGHPRLAFELDTFTWMHPHYELDEDWRARKGEVNGLRDWALGQGMAALNALELLLDEHGARDGLFPELVLFDCHACHRSLRERRWRPRVGTGLPPGVVRLNDSHLVMFRHVAGLVAPESRERLLDLTRGLHAGSRRDWAATREAAKALAAAIRELLPRVAAHPFGADGAARLLDMVVAEAERGEYADFAAAEQAAMATSSLLAAFEGLGLLEPAVVRGAQERLDALYRVLEDEDRYQPERFLAALRGLRGALP
ncbi:MAG: multiheme c-type cytochrome [Xanthomonadales bacterium]|nr:multiheme c-type cytochrome [Xanthomonadales bacterium]